MKLPPFEYRSPTTIDETVSLLAEYGDEAKVLAGGQSLLPLLAMRLGRPEFLIDINRVDELAGITVNGVLTIGALTRHRAGERSPEVRASVPLLAAALGNVGHDAIRTRGTIGGSVAHADPSAEMPTIVRTLGGTLTATSSRGSRQIAAEDFFQGFLMTSLEPDELLTSIELPIAGPRSGWSFKEFSRRSGDFALVGVAVALELDANGAVAEARIGLLGVAGEPARATAAEAVLVGATPGDEAFAAAAAAAQGEVSPTADLHGTAAYREHLTGVLVRQGLAEAFARAEGQI
jgi:carbon-monoxide dehydrogenase medium subunit